MMEGKGPLALVVSAHATFATLVLKRHVANFLSTFYDSLLKILGTIGIGSRFFFGHGIYISVYQNPYLKRCVHSRLLYR